MEILSCHSNQTKEPIFIKKKKKKKKKNHKLSIPQTKDATDDTEAKSPQWLQRKCCLKVLTPDVDRRHTTYGRRRRTTAYPISSPGAFGSGELKCTDYIRNSEHPPPPPPPPHTHTHPPFAQNFWDPA